KRYNIPGQVHFVTTTIYKNMWLFQDEQYCQIVIDNLSFYRKKYKFKLIGYVIMPWHLHLLLQLNKKWNNISQIMQFFKGHVADQILNQLKSDDGRLTEKFRLDRVSQSLCSDSTGTRAEARVVSEKRMKPNYRIWLPGFYDFNIYSEKKLIDKLNYIHNNPVKHGWAEKSEDWKYSSYRNYYLDDDSVIEVDKVD
ncbi:transposase, partial [Patescibacteria group bacterium]|nr:transposase [Patescibacteria group bacterium]